jgi:hypothetical protein
MKAGEAIAEILRREGVELVIGYPVNHVLEFAARVDIRPIIVRQERVGLHMADAIARLTSGKKVGVFAMQHGPGTENAGYDLPARAGREQRCLPLAVPEPPAAASSRSRSFECRRRAPTLSAFASAVRSLTRTTSRLPRVTPV